MGMVGLLVGRTAVLVGTTFGLVGSNGGFGGSTSGFGGARGRFWWGLSGWWAPRLVWWSAMVGFGGEKVFLPEVTLGGDLRSSATNPSGPSKCPHFVGLGRKPLTFW